MQLQHPQSVFGQHFSCFSLGSNSSIEAVAELLLAAGPYIYSSHLPVSLAAQYPSWVLLLAGAFDHMALAVSASIVSGAGQQLRAFAKSSSLNVSLTDNVVGPGLGVSMFWETWRRSHDALASVCPAASQQGPAQHSSLNIDQVAFQGTQYRWGWQQDHSKWGVSSAVGEGRAPLVVCLGDMNRAGWQAHRGGSYVCMQHPGLWQAFHGLLAAAESCVVHS
jgi:deoxyribonuclease-2